MQIEIHRKPSFRKGGPASMQAQVTVVTGERRNRRSITRHVVRRGTSWVGLNPDERAIPLNKQYEAELATAQNDLADAVSRLQNLQKKLEEIQEAEPKNSLDGIRIAAAKEMLKGMITTTALEVFAAETIVDYAKAKLEIVRDELPLNVEFVGPGLTY